MTLVVPTLHFGGLEAWTQAWATSLASLSPLVALGAGVHWLSARPRFARWTLLAVYPPLLGLTVALRPELTTRDVFDGLTLLLAAGSVVAYAAAAAHASSRPPQTKPVTARPLPRNVALREPRERTFLRRALLLISGAGAFALVTIAPVAASRDHRVSRWGESADDGAVLSVVVATVVAALAIGALVGPSLRAERAARHAPTQRRRRLALAALVGTVTGVGWLVLQHFDTSVAG